MASLWTCGPVVRCSTCAYYQQYTKIIFEPPVDSKYNLSNKVVNRLQRFYMTNKSLFYFFTRSYHIFNLFHFHNDQPFYGSLDGPLTCIPKKLLYQNIFAITYVHSLSLMSICRWVMMHPYDGCIICRWNMRESMFMTTEPIYISEKLHNKTMKISLKTRG